MKPCPLCDAERCELRQAEAFAFGVAVALAKLVRHPMPSVTRAETAHAVTEAMCSEHRIAYVLAMMNVTAVIARHEQGYEPDREELNRIALTALCPEEP